MIEKTYPLLEKQIFSLLRLEESLYEQLVQEADNLKHVQKVELLGHIAAHKKQLVEEMDQLSKQLGDLLAMEKLPNTPEGIQIYFQRAEKAGFSTLETVRVWSQIRALSADCKALNERNGACIELLSRHAKRSLHILKGKPQIVNTYGPDGITQTEYRSHPMASA